MALQETETGAKDHHTQRDHIDDDEVSELQRSSSFYQNVREQAERFASTRLGQFVIERVDRGLKLIEDTTKWSLPQEKNSTAVVLERPLPWAPFLLLIIMLRLTRIWVSVGALMIGNGPVSPTDMIYFIQTRRRKLRAIRVHGLRVMRHRQQEASSASGNSFTQQLSHWLNRAICRPGVQRANSGRAFNVTIPESQQQQQNKQMNQSIAKRPRDEDSTVDQNLTIDQMLAKYANENSEDDSDFVPNEENGSAVNSSSSSSSSSDSESETHTSEQISSNEEQENVEQQKELQTFKIHNYNQAKNQATVNGTNGSSEQTEVEKQRALELKQELWKSSPGHQSAALMNTRVYNNTAAAGSPNSFNSSLGTQALLKHVSINAVPTHSTPNTDLDDVHSTGSELEEATRESILLAHQTGQQDTPAAAKPFKQQQQQQQRQFNQSHQRFRGRNRR